MANRFDLSSTSIQMANAGERFHKTTNAIQRVEMSAEERLRRLEQLENRLRFEQEEATRASDRVYQATSYLDSGIGHLLHGLGTAQHVGEVGVRRAFGLRTDIGDNEFTRLGDTMLERAENLRSQTSGMYQEMLEQSQPSGSLLRPDEWSLGDRPTVEGVLTHIIGSMIEEAPTYAAIAAASMATMGTGGVAMATAARGSRVINAARNASVAVPATGAAMGLITEGGNQARENVERLRNQNFDQVLESSPVARRMLEERMPEMQTEVERRVTELRELLGSELEPEELARIVNPVMEQAETDIRRQLESDIRFNSGVLGGGAGLTTGAVLGHVFIPGGRGIAGIMKRAGAAAVVEGTQEVAAGTSGRLGYNLATEAGIALDENTFAEFFLGAGTGVGLGLPTAIATQDPEEVKAANAEIRADREAHNTFVNRNQDIQQRLETVEKADDLRQFLDPNNKDIYSPYTVLRSIHRVLESEAFETADEAEIQQLHQLSEEALAHSEALLKRRTNIPKLASLSEAEVQQQRDKLAAHRQEVEGMDQNDPNVQQRLATIDASMRFLDSYDQAKTLIAEEGGLDAYNRNTVFIEAESVIANNFVAQIDRKTGKLLNRNFPQTLSALRDNIKQIDNITEENTGAALSSEAANRVVMFAMNNPNQISQAEGKALLVNAMSTASPEMVRAYENISEARRLSEQAIQTNKKKSVAAVGLDILKGNRKTRDLGLEDYIERIPQNIQAGRTRTAQMYMGYLSAFAETHTNKAAALQRAMQMSADSQHKNEYHIRNIGEGRWEVFDGHLPGPVRASLGAINVSAATAKLAEQVKREAALINEVAVKMGEAVQGLTEGTNIESLYQQVEREKKSAEIAESLETPVEDREALREEISEKGMVPEDAPDSTATETTEKTESETEDQQVEQEIEQEAQNVESTVETETTTKNTFWEVVNGKEQVKPKYKIVAENVQLKDLKGFEKSLVDLRPIYAEEPGLFLNYDELAEKYPEIAKELFEGVENPEQTLEMLGTYLREEAFLTGRFEDEVGGMSPLRRALFRYLNQREKKTGAVRARNQMLAGLLSDQIDHKGRPVNVLSETGERFLQSMAKATMSWVADNQYHLLESNEQFLRSVLGIPEDMTLHTFMYQNPNYRILQNSVTGAQIIGNLAEPLSKALKLQYADTLPDNFVSQIEGHLGGIMLDAMLNLGLLEQHSVQLPNGNTIYTYSQPTSFVESRLNKDRQDNSLYSHSVDQYVRISEGLPQLFGEIRERAKPEKEVPTSVKTKIKNTVKKVPEYLRKYLQTIQAKKHFIDETGRDFFTRLDIPSKALEENPIALVMGYSNEAALATMGKANREKAITRNKEIEREILTTREALQSYEDKPFYYRRKVALQQRVMLDNAFNPNENKFYRSMVRMESWKRSINDANGEVAFLAGFAEALGFKTDGNTTEDAVNFGRAHLQVIQDVLKGKEVTGDMSNFAAVISQMVADPNDMNGELVANFLNGEEGFHTLTGLLQAIEAGKYANENGGSLQGFTHSLWREVDGKTNGPMLALLMLGNAASALTQDLLKLGGFLTKDQTENNLSEYAQKIKRDLYTTVSRDLIPNIEAHLHDSKATEKAKAFRANMYDSFNYFYYDNTEGNDKKRAKKERNLAKPITTQVFYGAGTQSIISDKIVGELLRDSIYSNFENIAADFRAVSDDVGFGLVKTKLINSQKKLEQLTYSKGQKGRMAARMLNVINRINRNEFKDTNEISAAILAATDLNTDDLSVMANKMSGLLKTPITNTLKNLVGQYLDTAQDLNQSANFTHVLYTNLKEAMIQKRTNELVKEGLLPPTEKGFTLPIGELKKIEKRLEAIAPWVHTPMSKRDDGSSNGSMAIGKKDIEQLIGSQYESKIMISEMWENSPEGVRPTLGDTKYSAQGIAKRILSAPGVGTIVKMIHSIDAAIAHAKGVDDSFDLINVHDAKIGAAEDAIAFGQELNKNTFKILRDYSLARELRDSFVRTMQAYIREYNNAARNNDTETMHLMALAYHDTVAEMSLIFRVEGDEVIGQVNDMPISFSGIYNRLNNLSRRTELQKLTYMRDQLKSIDQYTINDGQYAIDADDLAVIEKRIAELLADVPDSQFIGQLNAFDAQLLNKDGEFTLDGQRISDAFVEAKNRIAPESRLNTDEMRKVWKNTLKSDLEFHDDRETGVDILTPEKRKEINQKAKKAQISYVSKIVSKNDLYGTKGMMPFKNVAEILGNLPQALGHHGSIPMLLAYLKNETKANKLGDIPVFFIDSAESPTLQHLADNFGLGEEQMAAFMSGKQQAFYSVQVTKEGRKEAAREVIVVKADGFVGKDGKAHTFDPEQFLHEAYHAMVSGKVAQEMNKPTHKRTQAFRQLEAVHQVVLDLIKNSHDNSQWSRFRPMLGELSNLQEFVAYGMTHPALMRQMKEAKLDSQAVQIALKNNKLPPNTLNLAKRGWNKVQSLMGAWINSMMRFLGKNTPQEQTVFSTFLYGNISLMNSRRNPLAAAKLTPAEVMQMSMNIIPDQTQQVADMDNVTVFDSLASQKDSPEISKQLRNVMETIQNKLKNRVPDLVSLVEGQTALRPEDLYVKGLQRGKLPFASWAKGSPLYSLTNQQAFALDQIEAVFATSLKENHAVYRSLHKMYQAAQNTLTAQDLYAGDWATATQRERDGAQELLDELFSMDHHPESNYLAQFAAQIMANPTYNRALANKTLQLPKSKDKATLGTKMNQLWENSADILLGDLEFFKKDKKHVANIENMLHNLADIEAANKNIILDTANDAVQVLEKITDGGFDFAKNKISQAIDNRLESYGNTEPANGMAALERAGIKLGKLVAEDHVSIALQGVMNQHYAGKAVSKQGWFPSTLNEIRGVWDSYSQTMNKLIRGAKSLEHERMLKANSARENLLGAFANNGKNLTKEQKVAVTKGLLRTDTQSITDTYSLDTIEIFYENRGAILSEISEVRETLRQEAPELFGYFDVAIKDLAQFKATEEVQSDLLFKNAHEIANLSLIDVKVPQEAVVRVQGLIDQLITLESISRLPEATRQEVAQLMNQENNRTDQDGKLNGIEVALQYHRIEQKKVIDSEYRGEARHLEKGYVSDILNDKKIAVKATKAEGKLLEARGYVRGPRVTNDKFDIFNEPLYLYSFRNGGMGRVLTGALSYTSSTLPVHDRIDRKVVINSREDIINLEEQIKEIYANKVNAFMNHARNNETYDPSELTEGQMVPILNRNGSIESFVYVNTGKAKDNLLDRNDTFEDVLGRMVSQHFDKVASQENNRAVMEALKEQYDRSKHFGRNMFVEVGPETKDAELRELYMILSEETKEHIEKVWGGPTMMVRRDALDHVFGYRKYTLASSLQKEAFERSIVENAYATVIGALFKDKAELRGAQLAEFWDTTIKHIRDMAVIKNMFTLLLNIRSNTSQLLLEGLSLKQSLTLQREGLANALAYRRDSAELESLRQLVELEQYDSRIEQRIKELELALETNKAAVLIKEGLMPTIVESIDTVKDPFAYKSQIEEKIDAVGQYVPDLAKTVLKNIYMTHDTVPYKFMEGAAQLSDFTARYALYQYNTQLRPDKLDHAAAVEQSSEVFINYDIPTHKYTQWMNDAGLMFYTKYYWRVQKQITRNLKERTTRTVSMAMLEMMYRGAAGTVLGSYVPFIWGNPLHKSILKYPGAVSNTAVISTLRGIVN